MELHSPTGERRWKAQRVTEIPYRPFTHPCSTRIVPEFARCRVVYVMSATEYSGEQLSRYRCGSKAAAEFADASAGMEAKPVAVIGMTY
jgi:hypothetical protein